VASAERNSGSGGVWLSARRWRMGEPVGVGDDAARNDAAAAPMPIGADAPLLTDVADVLAVVVGGGCVDGVVLVLVLVVAAAPAAAAAAAAAVVVVVVVVAVEESLVVAVE
jgi:hypothetical protein